MLKPEREDYLNTQRNLFSLSHVSLKPLKNGSRRCSQKASFCYPRV